MDFKTRWINANERFSAMSPRERRLIAAAAVGGIFFLGNFFLMEPELARAKALRAGIEQQRADIANMRNELVTLQARAKEDPDTARKGELSALQEKLNSADQELARVEGALVPPERMNAVLEALLRRHPGLRLVSLRTLQPDGLLGMSSDKGEKGGGAAALSLKSDFDLFRHGVEFQLEGSYADLNAYLEQLEKGPQKFLWGPVRLAVVEYPRVRLSVVVYTLSSEKAWLAI